MADDAVDASEDAPDTGIAVDSHECADEADARTAPIGAWPDRGNVRRGDAADEESHTETRLIEDMAESTFTQMGVAEMRAAIDAFLVEVTARLKANAVGIGGRMRNTAAANLLLQTNAEKTAAAIEVFVDDPNKTVSVVSRGVSADPANNPIWLEHGTIHETAKPYMLPAAQQYEAEYLTSMQAIADDVPAQVFGS